MKRKSLWGGLDAGMDHSRLCLINEQLEPVLDVTLPSRVDAIHEALSAFSKVRIEDIAFETSAPALRLVRGLREAGYTATLYDAWKVSRYLRIRRNKTDNNDARGLAELAKLRLPSLASVHLKSPEIQRLRTKLQFRHKLTVQRVACEGMIRSLIGMHGGRLKSSYSAAALDRNVRDELSRLRGLDGADLSADLLPLLKLAISMRVYLERVDAEFSKWANTHPVCSRFLKIPGVGPICAVSFFTAIEDPDRFRTATDVGPYLGLTPMVLQSGGSLRHAGISKRGSKLTRSHLVNSATVILGPRTEDHPLKAWGLSLAERAGRGKARVAVARRLAITMLAMWKNGSSYDAALSAAKVCG